MTVKLSILVILSAIAAASSMRGTTDMPSTERTDAAGTLISDAVNPPVTPDAIADRLATTTAHMQDNTANLFSNFDYNSYQLAKTIAKSPQYDNWLSMCNGRSDIKVALLTGLYIDNSKTNAFATFVEENWEIVDDVLLSMTNFDHSSALIIGIKLGMSGRLHLAQIIAYRSLAQLDPNVNLKIFVDAVQYIDPSIAGSTSFISQHGIFKVAAATVAIVVKQHKNVDFLNNIEPTLVTVYNEIPKGSSTNFLNYYYSKILYDVKHPSEINSEFLLFCAEQFAVALDDRNGDRQLKDLINEEQSKFDNSN